MTEVKFYEHFNGIFIDRVSRVGEFNMPGKHYHPEYEIYYLLNGERYYFISDKVYLVKKGSLVFINRNQIHKTGGPQSDEHERLLINIDQKGLVFLQKLAGDFNIAGFFSSHIGVLQLTEQEQIYFEELLENLQQEVGRKLDGYIQIAGYKIMEILIFAKRCYIENPKRLKPEGSYASKYDKIECITSYIGEHYQNKISLEELSKKFYLSKYYMCRIFKEVTGFTVTEYQNIIRVRKALELLEDTGLSITEISALAGFESITYFERVFQKYIDASPLAYRKRNRK